MRALLASCALLLCAVPVAAQHQLPPRPPDRMVRPVPRPAAPGEVGVLPVQGNIYMLNLGDVNVTAQVGDEGILLVDSGPADMADKLIAALQRRFEGKRIRQLVNTHAHPDHSGGNGAVVRASGGGGGGGGGGRGGGGGLRIIAHENTFNRMSGAVDGEKERPQDERPTSTFRGPGMARTSRFRSTCAPRVRSPTAGQSARR